MANDLGYIKKSIQGIEEAFKEFKNQHVTNERFDTFVKTDYGLTKRLVQGCAGMILTITIIAILATVFKGGIVFVH